MQNPLLRVFKNTGALFVGTIGRMVITFGFVIYLARYLGVEGFGKYELALSYFDLFLSLGATGLTILITREIAHDSSSLNQYVSGAIVLVVALSLAAGPLLLLIAAGLGYDADTRLVDDARLGGALSRGGQPDHPGGLYCL